MTEKKKQLVYFLSGLGIDERAFSRIQLPEGFEIRFIRWIEPEANEVFSAYCKRLSAQIDTTQPVILAGLSFGGVTACELSKQIETQKIILLSSIPVSAELPLLYRFLSAIGLRRLVPIAWIKRANFISYWLMGMKTKEEKLLLKNIMADMSGIFLRWATKTIVDWKNEKIPANTFRIHGTKDRVLYYRKGMDFTVKGAGHFMAYTHAVEVNAALAKILAN
jgi:pimeloyl-ACP methyl ester carboxylesterase